ncbi:tail Collar domain-containing protein [Azorhizobium oxalatiphilum]|uniref:Tail Collar domain-containing protein n=1 Tax=Azorhizobium oxalatiphilum TaxID=980631 RepID=A0A917C0C5_9HYPH|nr:tail fiber protein [Azorhizobium oxalatiphilum]GGF66172.1 tail Collar domain-containing protein [Azorhizobium oxalatiphilum]
MNCYVGEIRLAVFPIIPAGWLPCDGRIVAVADYKALFSLLGSMYGGDGDKTFGLPDLRGRTPVNMRDVTELSKSGGTETVALALDQIPSHTHPWLVSSKVATEGGVGGNFYAAPPATTSPPAPANTPNVPLYAAPATPAGIVPIYEGCLRSTGDGTGHTNMQPYVVLNYLIAFGGVFPVRP